MPIVLAIAFAVGLAVAGAALLLWAVPLLLVLTGLIGLGAFWWSKGTPGPRRS